MIDFIHKFVQALSDEELKFLAQKLNDEQYGRINVKAKLIGAFPELCVEEKDFIRKGQVIDAMKLYRTRNGCNLLEARDVCEKYKDSL
jgi:biotin carboxyl carrier protein